jgi:hypothetical protein
LGGEAQRQADQHVGDVGRVARDDPRVHAAPDPVDDELPDRGAGLDFVRPGVEIGKGPFEHHPGQRRAVPDERAQGRDRLLQGGSFVISPDLPFEVASEQPESLEEYGPEPALRVVADAGTTDARHGPEPRHSRRQTRALAGLGENNAHADRPEVDDHRPGVRHRAHG